MWKVHSSYTNPQIRLGLRKSKKSFGEGEETEAPEQGQDNEVESAAPPQKQMPSQPSKKVPVMAPEKPASEASTSSAGEVGVQGEDAAMSKMCKSLLLTADKVLASQEKSLSAR